MGIVLVSSSRSQKYYSITLFNSPRYLEFRVDLAYSFLTWVHGSLARKTSIIRESKFMWISRLRAIGFI